MRGPQRADAVHRDPVIQALTTDPDRFRVIRAPSVPGGLGPDELAELSRVAAPDVSQGPRLPVPEGWTELRVRDVHQTLLLGDATRNRGIRAQLAVTLSGASSGRGGTGPETAALPSPDDLLLAVERWSGGGWNGVHAAWLHDGADGVIQHRRWDLPATGGVELTVTARYAAALGRYLDHRVDAMVAGLEVSDAGPRPGSVDRAAERFSQWQASRQVPAVMPAPIELGSAGVDWIDRLPQLAEANRGRLEVAPPPAPADVVTADLAYGDGRPTEAGQRIGRTRREARARVDLHGSDATGSSPVGRLWLDEDRVLAVSAPSVQGGPHQVGLYRRDRTAELILRMLGFVPEGPHSAPEAPLTWDQLTGREPLPEEAGVPESWRGDSRRVWQVMATTHGGQAGSPQGPPVAMQVLSVPGWGHYLLGPAPSSDPRPREASSRFRLRERSGLALVHDLRALVRHAGGRRPVNPRLRRP